VVTTTVLGDIVGRIVGDAGTVEVLMQPGQDPHGFAVSARQAQALRRADLVVANGLQLEESLLDVIEAAEGDGVAVLRVAEQLDPIAFGDGDGDEAAEGEHPDDDQAGEDVGDHDHEGGDPHVWYDPVRMAEGAALIADRLAAVDDTLGDEDWAVRGAMVADAILAAHEQVVAILDAVADPCRILVTSHDSFGYFAARYDFEVIATVIPGTSSQAEPSAQGYAELIRTIESSQVPAIFAETIRSTRLAETLAAEIGRHVEVVTLFTDSLGEPGSGADSYTGMLTTNAQRIADALAPC
jgi:zinc/manganese transport system substrate-binding protein